MLNHLTMHRNYMKEILIKLFFVFLSASLFAQTKIKSEEILHQAELKRLPWNKMSVYATLIDSSNGGNVKTTYHVFFEKNKTLVDCIEPIAQKGNLLLLQNHEMWFYINSTSQPMKMTPLQRLSGSVSFLDIARLNWSDDYKIDSIETTKQETYLIHLTSNSPKISYKRINLWIDKKTKKAIREDIYLSSEKLYKTIVFTKYQIVSGKEMNSEIEFIDHFNKDRKSVIIFSKAEQQNNLPSNYFIKEKLPEVSKTINN